MMRVAVRRPKRSGLPPAPEMLLLPGGETPIRWQRSRQARRVSLRIDPRAGMVVVTLPPRTGREAGLALLHAHSTWISGKLAALPGRIAFDADASVSLSGVAHVIRHHPEARRGVWAEAGEIRVSGDRAFLQRRVLDFLRGAARDVLGVLVRQISDASGAGGDAPLWPRRLAIKDTSSRWGSCSSDGVVMFSWRLVMAPPEIQHYVVAHELAHLRHLDHSQHFWSLVGTLTPHRVRAEAWLRLHGAALLRMG